VSSCYWVLREVPLIFEIRIIYPHAARMVIKGIMGTRKKRVDASARKQGVRYNEDMFYGEVFKALNKAKVKYVVAGGVAVALHGYQRFTQDLDLYVLLETKNFE